MAASTRLAAVRAVGVTKRYASGPATVVALDTVMAALPAGRLTVVMDPSGRASPPRNRVGFVFQSFNLLPAMSAGENLLMPLRIAGRRPDRDWTDRVIDAVGLRARLGHRPGELSGGEQQRRVVARALTGQATVVFDDEATGNLDSHASAALLELLRRCADDFGQTWCR